MVEQVLQDDGLVVFGVFSSVDEGGMAPAGGLFKKSNLWTIMFEFGLVSRSELGPFGGIVSEPLSEFTAGGDFFQPEVDTGFFLR